MCIMCIYFSEAALWRCALNHVELNVLAVTGLQWYYGIYLFILHITHFNIFIHHLCQKENSSLSQLSSGLHSFKLHFDWLLYWHNQSGLTSNKTKEIISEIHRSISILERKQVRSTVVEKLISCFKADCFICSYNRSPLCVMVLLHVGI